MKVFQECSRLIGVLFGIFLFISGNITIHGEIRVPEDYPTIQKAIDAASEGAVIVIAQGTWEENIVIKKPVVLQGNGFATVLKGANYSYSPTITISSESSSIAVRIENLTIIERSKGLAPKCISIGGDSYVEINQCRVSCTSDDGDGIVACDYARLNLLETDIFGSDTALRAEDFSQIMISNCLFFHNEDGVVLEDFAQARISSCQLFGQRGDAICIYGAAWAVICRNIIKSNRGFGILSYSNERTTGEENVMEGNGVDLGGNVSGSLRIPLREPTEREIIFPDPRYHHLQEAVDALVPGGTLRIKPGTYRTNVTVGKKIRVVGEKGACLVHYSQKPWLPEYFLPVLSLVGGAEVEIYNLDLQASSLAVLMVGADARLVMENCSIIGHRGSGENVEYGILLMNSTSARFSNCVISQNIGGFMLRDAAQAEISYCEISHGVYGVYLKDSARAHISNNCFRDNRCGIHSVSLGEVEGNGNRMIENGVDLVGNIPGTLRTTLCTRTEIEIRFPDDRYSSLQEAVDALLPGGKLILEAGQYLAGVTIDKPVTLEAAKENGAILTARREYAPVLSLVGGADVVLNGLLITSGKEDYRRGEGIVLGRNARALLKNCTILQNYKGIILQGHAQAVLTDCGIHKNYYGVLVKNCARVSIINSSISENQYVGIALEDVTQAVILNCSITSNMGDGLRLQDNANLEMENTQILLNDGYGLVANLADCRSFSKAHEFMGYVRGTGNIIPGPPDPTGNKRGGLCPPYPGAPWPANFLRNHE